MQLIDLQAQRRRISENIDTAMTRVLAHGQFINGPEVKQLSAQLTDIVGTSYCIPCGNGTDALQLALMALDIGPGDLVFVPAFSFFASAEVVCLTGAKVAFVDICQDTYNMCPQALEDAVLENARHPKGKPGAVIVVDLFGQPANYPAIVKVCDKYGLKLIEDAAQSFGATLQGKVCGSFGDIATTSFFPAKPLGCYGDGGAIFCDDPQLASKLNSLANHGKGEHKYDNIRVGLNSRLDTLQAAILLEKLTLFSQEITLREHRANTYTNSLNQTYITPVQIADSHSVWAQYALQPKHRPRAEILEQLNDAGVPTAIYYPTALPDLPAMSEQIVYSAQNARHICQNIFSIPMHPWLESEDQNKVIETLLEIAL